MKKLLLITALLLVPSGLAQADTWMTTQTQLQQQQTNPTVTGASTPCPAGSLCYTPLEPLPGATYGSNGYGPNGGTFVDYLNTVFKLMLTLGSIFAVVMLVYGGIIYMTSGVAGQIGAAKERMKAALWGLALLAGAWLILYTLNPQLLLFNLNPQSINQGTPTPATTQQTTNGNSQTPPQITVNRIQVGESVKIYNGTSAYDQITNYNSQCSGSMHQVGPGTDSGGDYVTWQCQ